jgi:hypothetical protein
MDDPRLPAEYGQTRLVLLVVDPYLVHAYWEVAPEKLRQAKKLAGQAKPVLRFHRESERAPGAAEADSFDVAVDLQSHNWYVHLWSPEESLYADLALKRNDGTFIRLVRSQVVHMPRVRPAIAIDQHFMKIEPTDRRAEIVPPPPVQHDRAQKDIIPAASELPVEEIKPPVEDIKLIDAGEIVREKLKELYASVEPRRSQFRSNVHPVESSSPAPPSTKADTDLTESAESDFDTGLSSGALQKSDLESGPDSRG